MYGLIAIRIMKKAFFDTKEASAFEGFRYYFKNVASPKNRMNGKPLFNYVVIVALVVITSYFVLSCEQIKDAIYVRYSVTFDLNYEGNPAATEVKVNEGEKVDEPAKPTRTGWTFVGWFKDTAGRTTWNFATEVVNADMTLYAKWEEKIFTVTFNTNGGNTVASKNVREGEKVTEPSIPTRNGYRFDGWFKDNTASTSVWNFSNDVVTANVTLYAKWTQIFNVTFDTDGGSEAPVLQTVANGEKASKPTDPTKYKAGLYSGTVQPEETKCTFAGWYNGNTEWDFATNVVTANITLTAKWTGGGNPIAAVAANDVPTTFTYINANAGTYTLMMDRDVTLSATQTLNLAQRHLTIIGLGGERKITSDYRLFNINNADASLTIGDNITLACANYGDGVCVQAGSLTMKTGSKITSHKAYITGSTYYNVRVSGVNSIFTMEGGEISGNDNYGVLLESSATFAMSGGRIVSNKSYDVDVASNAGTFTLSGNAEIAALVLAKANNGVNSSITIGTGGFTGIVSALHLYVNVSDMNTVISQWTQGTIVPAVIKGVTDASVLSRFTLGIFKSGSYSNNTRNISPDYKLELVGSDAKLVWR